MSSIVTVLAKCNKTVKATRHTIYIPRSKQSFFCDSKSGAFEYAYVTKDKKLRAFAAVKFTEVNLKKTDKKSKKNATDMSELEIDKLSNMPICLGCQGVKFAESSIAVSQSLWDMFATGLEEYIIVTIQPEYKENLPKVNKVSIHLIPNTKDISNRLACLKTHTTLSQKNNKVLFQSVLDSTIQLPNTPTKILLFNQVIDFYIKVFGSTIPNQHCSKCAAAYNLACLITSDIVIDDFFFDDKKAVQNGKVSKIEYQGFSAVGGYQEILNELKESFLIPLAFPSLFKHFNVKPPRCLLLHGPSGTGKTFICHAFLNEIRHNWDDHIKEIGKELDLTDSYKPAPKPVVEVVSCNSIEKSQDGLKVVRADLRLTNTNTPTILLFDEIDALCEIKSEDVDYQISKQFTAMIITFLDGLEESPHNMGQNVVLATTCDPSKLDSSLRRAGRFDRDLEVSVPNVVTRQLIFEKLLSSLPHSLNTEDINSVVNDTQAFVAADLKNLCTTAASFALQQTVKIGKKSKPIVTLNQFQEARLRVRPSGMREVMIEIPHVYWNDIGGYESTKQMLQECVEWPIKYQLIFKTLELTPPKGVLLYGPPGCSKTLMAKAVATESKMNFLAVKGPELMSKYFGESERAIRNIFHRARMNSPCIIFFDEIDAVGVKRSGEADGPEIRILSQLLNEMDGIEAAKVATNYKLMHTYQTCSCNRSYKPTRLSGCCTFTGVNLFNRPGRLDRLVYVPLPDLHCRKDILKVHSKWFHKNTETPMTDIMEFLGNIAERTEGYSGAELAMICREAAMSAVQSLIDRTCKSLNLSFTEFQKLIEKAMANIKPRISKNSILFYDHFHKTSLKI